MIGAAQAIELYEIARYGTLCEWAKELGDEEAHTVQTSILEEEIAANSKLTSLAVTTVNTAPHRKAAQRKIQSHHPPKMLKLGRPRFIGRPIYRITQPLTILISK